MVPEESTSKSPINKTQGTVFILYLSIWLTRNKMDRVDTEANGNAYILLSTSRLINKHLTGAMEFD